METKTTTTAIVTLTIEIHHAGGSWGGDCPLSQVYKQAKDSALGAIQNLSNPQNAADLARRIRVVGEPTVKAVTVEQER